MLMIPRFMGILISKKIIHFGRRKNDTKYGEEVVVKKQFGRSP